MTLRTNTQLPTAATTGDAVAVVDTQTTNSASAEILVPISAAAVLTSSQNVPSVAATTASSGGATLVAKASAGNLLSFYAMNRNAAARYVVFCNQTGAVSALTNMIGSPIYLPAGTALILDSAFFTLSGWYFSAGISIGISTSSTTFTAATAADHDVTATFTP